MKQMKKYPASRRRTVRDAFVRSLPVMAGYVVLGIGFGIMMHDAGYGIGWSVAMSVTIFAGSAQYVGVSLLSAQALLLTAAMTTLMVNARHLFYSISMVDKYRGAGKKKPYLIFALTDETYSLLCSWQIPPEEDPHLFAFLVSLFDHLYWVAGSLIGAAIGAALPFSTDGVAFSMTALFIATMTEQWLTMDNHIPAITGLLCSFVCLLIFGSQQFLIPSMIAITLVLSVFRAKIEPDGKAGEKEREASA